MHVGDFYDEEEYFLVHCPKEFDPKLLIGTEINLEGDTSIEFGIGSEAVTFKCIDLETNPNRHLNLLLPNEDLPGVRLVRFPKTMDISWTENIDKPTSKILPTSPDKSSCFKDEPTFVNSPVASAPYNSDKKIFEDRSREIGHVSLVEYSSERSPSMKQNKKLKRNKASEYVVPDPILSDMSASSSVADSSEEMKLNLDGNLFQPQFFGKEFVKITSDSPQKYAHSFEDQAEHKKDLFKLNNLSDNITKMKTEVKCEDQAEHKENLLNLNNLSDNITKMKTEVKCEEAVEIEYTDSMVLNITYGFSDDENTEKDAGNEDSNTKKKIIKKEDDENNEKPAKKEDEFLSLDHKKKKVKKKRKKIERTGNIHPSQETVKRNAVEEILENVKKDLFNKKSFPSKELITNDQKEVESVKSSVIEELLGSIRKELFKKKKRKKGMKPMEMRKKKKIESLGVEESLVDLSSVADPFPDVAVCEMDPLAGASEKPINDNKESANNSVCEMDPLAGASEKRINDNKESANNSDSTSPRTKKRKRKTIDDYFIKPSKFSFPFD